jgi:CheY-like chemotaxis protein/HPt (histidine-containing phosphotransfer) domain-containing protein
VSFAKAGVNAPRKEGKLAADLAGMPFSLDVLVVEDNEVNAMVACGLLRRSGHRPSLASTGEAAIEHIRARAFDVVMMDLRLPDIDGVEVTKRIRAMSSPAKARTPIVAVSAQADAGDIESFRRAGVNDFLGKPFHLDRLDATLRRVVLRHDRHPGRKPLQFRPPEAPAPEALQGRAAGEPIDATVLGEHVDVLGFEQTARIVATFESSVASVPDEIEALAAEGECSKVANLAHRVKSSALHVGLVRLSDAAAMLERQARNENYDELILSAGALAEECRMGLGALKRCFARIAEAQPANT